MKGRSMFCAGELPNIRYGVYETKIDAMSYLGPDAHYPDPDEMRHIWLKDKLYELRTSEVQQKLGVTRQAVSLWRKKAGADLPRLTDHLKEQRIANIKAVLNPDLTAAEIADIVGTSAHAVKEVAEQMGVALQDRSSKKPPDDEIIRLAKGKTWRELAAACNVSLYTLRNYVYADQDLRGKVCANLVHEQMGQKAHGKIDVDELIRRYEAGQSTFKIAAHFGTQPMSIIYWLKKLDIYRGADAKAEGTTGR